MSSSDLELGPIDVVVIAYPPDAPATGEAIPLFLDLVDKGIIRVLDVLAMAVGEDGTITALDFSDIDGDGYQDLLVFQGAQSGLLGDEDAIAAGESLEPGTAAVLICYENRWAAPFASAVHRNGGQVVAFERIPTQDVLDAAQALA